MVNLNSECPGPAAGDPSAALEASERARRVATALVRLPATDRRVVTLRFGFDGPPLTLREVGWLLQVSAERVRQIQTRAMRRLHKAAAITGIGDYAPRHGEG